MTINVRITIGFSCFIVIAGCIVFGCWRYNSIYNVAGARTKLRPPYKKYNQKLEKERKKSAKTQKKIARKQKKKSLIYNLNIFNKLKK